MLRSRLFYIKLLLLTLLFFNNSNAIDLSIIPLKKPILDKITEQINLAQGIIKPKPKPIKKEQKQTPSSEIAKPESQPSEQTKEKETKIIKKKS